MAPRMSWNLHLNPHTTQINTRLVHLDAVAIYRYQNRTHSTSILGPSFLELTPPVLESQARCLCYVSDKLVTMSIDPYSIDWFAPQIASYAIAAASRVGDDDGFYLIAKLEIIMDDYYPLDIPIPMYGADYSTHGIDEHIWLQDEPIWLHDGDGGVIVLDAVEEDDMHMDMIRPRGASKSVIDKLIRKGRLADNDDVKGTCPVCLEDFVHRRTATEMLRMPCSHLFHHHCIVPWLQKNDSCPMCRKSVAV